jgi:microcystin-dependent protein
MHKTYYVNQLKIKNMNSLIFKHSKTQLLILVLAFVLIQLTQAQIGINTVNPDNSAALDVVGNGKGILIPRLSTADRTALMATAADGLLVYDKDQKIFYFKNGATAQWESLNYNINANTVNANTVNSVTSTTTTASVTTLNATTVNATQGFGIVPKGSILSWCGPITGNFDATGNGLGSYAGWAICNGSNGTPNLSGRFIVSYSAADADYNDLGKTGGEKMHTLTQAEMPYHAHAVVGSTSTDGAHSHYYNRTPESGNGYSDGSLRRLNHESYEQTSTDGAHAHSINFTSGAAGGNVAFDKRPLYFVLLFIMRIK